MVALDLVQPLFRENLVSIDRYHNFNGLRLSHAHFVSYPRRSIKQLGILAAFFLLAIDLAGCGGGSNGGSGGAGAPSGGGATTVITAQPADVVVTPGNSATFTIAATGSNLRYQWQGSADGGTTWTDVSGATMASLVVASTTPTINGNRYRVNVAGDNGDATSQAALLTVSPPPQGPAISQQPADASVTVPATATFQVVAADTATLAYQWQISTHGGAGFTDIPGATGASYTTQPTVLADGGDQFRVVVTNSVDSATSSAATLTVAQQTGAAQCATQVLPVGTVIRITSVSSSNSAFQQLFIGSANGTKKFHGISVPELEVQLRDNTSGIDLDVKTYGSLDSITGVITNIGTYTHVITAIGLQTVDSVADAVYTPAFIDRRYTLTAGQTMSQTWTQDDTTTVTANGTPAAPSTTTITETITTTFVDNEQITVPAGTFNTCKFIDSVSDGQSTSQTTHWLLVGYGVDIQSISNGTTVSAQSISVNGVALQ